MIIDGNPTETEAMKEFLKGNAQEGSRLQDIFIAEFLEAIKTQDYCPCKGCKYHGKCLECVAIHRGHRHHLPNCFRDMVNEKLCKLSELTEHTVLMKKNEG